MRFSPASALLTVLWLAFSGVAAAEQEQVAAGARALRDGDPAAAIAAFEAALAADGANGEAWLGLSAAAEMSGDWTRALGAARRAVALAPERVEALLAVARLLVRADRVEEALTAFRDVREVSPANAEAFLLPAIVLRDGGRADEAFALLEEGFLQAPSAAMGEQLAYMALATGQPARALEVADAALEAAPDSGDLMLAKALALAAEPSRRAGGAEWFESALSAGVSREGQARLEWARLLADLERWAEAAGQLERVTTLLPTNTEAYFRLATARRQLGNVAGAASALARYEELDAERTAAERRVRELGTALNEAQGEASANRLPAALARIEAVEGHESDARLMLLKAKILFSMNRREEALVAISRASRLAPLEVEASYLTALFAFSARRFGDSLTAVDRTLTLDPRVGEAWALRGSTLARLTRLEDAIASFERALALGYDSPQMRLDWASVLSDLGRGEESAAQLEARRKLMGG